MSEETKDTTLFCYVHPNRETMLRCSRCERPICPTCAVLTPTGYRCKECLRGQQKIFETAQWIDYPLAILVAGGLSFLGSIAAQALGFFTIFIAPIAGVIIAEAVRWVIRRRRSRLLFRLATLAAIAGGLPLLLRGLFFVFIAGGGPGLFSLFAILWPGVYVFLVASTVYYRLSGIRIR
jgi:hypothetical protein